MSLVGTILQEGLDGKLREIRPYQGEGAVTVDFGAELMIFDAAMAGVYHDEAGIRRDLALLRTLNQGTHRIWRIYRDGEWLRQSECVPTNIGDLTPDTHLNPPSEHSIDPDKRFVTVTDPIDGLRYIMGNLGDDRVERLHNSRFLSKIRRIVNPTIIFEDDNPDWLELVVPKGM